MSGNIGEKARAAFLALIMVTSVMAAGVAFSGSAVALEDPSNEGEFGGIVIDSGSSATDAELSSSETAKITLTTIQSSGTDVNGKLDKINVTFGQDVGAGDVTLSDGTLTGVNVEVIDSNGKEVIDGLDTTGTVNSKSSNSLTIDSINLNNDVSLGADSIIRLSITEDKIDLPSSGNLDAEVGIADNNANEATTDLTLQLNPGPVQVDGGASYTSIDRALSQGSFSGGETITVEDGLYDEVDSELNIPANDVTIESADGDNTGVKVISTYDASTTRFINDGDNEGVTIRDLRFDVRVDAEGVGDAKLDVLSSQANNLTLENNVFNVTTNKLGNAGTDDMNILFLDSTGVDDGAELIDNEFRRTDSSSGSNNLLAVQAAQPETVVTGNTFETDDGVFITAKNHTVKNNEFNMAGFAVAANGDNVLIDNNDIEATGSTSSGAVGLLGGDNITLQDNTIDGLSTEFDNGIDLKSGQSSALGNVTITGNSISNVTTNGLLIEDTSTFKGNTDAITVSDLTVDNAGASGAPTGTGVKIDIGDGNLPDIDISASSINATGTGIDVQNAGAFVNVSGTSVDNTASGSQAINLANAGADVNIDSGTSIDQADTGILVNVQTTNSVDITNVDINGTSSGIDITNVNDDSATAVNVTDSTFTNNDGAGLNYSASTSISKNPATVRLNVHFNTFENNDVGIGFDDQANTNFKGIFNATFNDFVDNDIAGLDVERIDSDDGGVVNANYSHWGDTTGPADADDNINVNNAFGDGDSVALSSSGDATVFPYLTASTSNTISSAQQSGAELIVIPDPEKPIGDSNDDNTALVTVTNLNESVGATNADLFAPAADSPPTQVSSPSGSLAPNDAALFRVNLSSPGTIDVQGVADGASSSTVQQTYTGQSADIQFITNRSGVTSDAGLQIVAQASDANGDSVERQGLNVRFAEDSGFADAGVTFTSRDGNTNNNGNATAVVGATSQLSPGSEFSVTANIDGNVVTQNFTTAAGEIDSGASTLRLDGSASDLGNLQVNETVDVSAQIQDSNNNPLEGRSVEFSSNGTVTFGSSSVETDADGFANTTVTLDTQTQGVVAINASAGSFNVSATPSAQRNITTVAAAPTQLGFASDTSSLAPTADVDLTVQLQDEFGNLNTSANVNNGITVTSSDTSVLSVSGVDDLSGNSDTFTVTGESAGTSTLNVTSDDGDIAGVEREVTVANPDGLELTVPHNVATTSAADANGATVNQVTVEAQFVDSNGSALGIDGENITFARQSGSAAELNQSAEFTKNTDTNGNVTIDVNGTDTTGETTFIALAENFSVQGSAAVTTTGAADTVDVSPETDTLSQNETTNVTAQFIDSEGRNVPRVGTSIQLSADSGTVTDSPQSTAVTDGSVVATFTYNGTEAGQANLTALGGGLSGTATVTVTAEAADDQPVESPGDLTGDGEAATDPDGDGAFEDINGDGTVTAADVTALFNELGGGSSSDARLDINGEGDGLTAADVTALFDEV